MSLVPSIPVDRELDAATVRRAQAGSAADQQALVQRYEKPVFALIGRMLIPRGRSTQVKDVAQDTFLRVLRSLPRFKTPGPARLSTWILTIATRAVFDELRRPRAVEEPLERAAGVADRNAERFADQVGLRGALVLALGALEPDRQAVVLLRDVHELEYEEIAEALQINVGTVKSRLNRARGALRAALSEKGFQP